MATVTTPQAAPSSVPPRVPASSTVPRVASVRLDNVERRVWAGATLHDRVFILCYDQRLAEGQLLRQWLQIVVGRAVRRHEFDVIRFGGDTVDELEAEDDARQLPGWHASHADAHNVAASGAASASAGSSSTSSKVPAQASSAMMRIASRLQRRKGRTRRRSRTKGNITAPSPGFMQLFIRYFTRKLARE